MESCLLVLPALWSNMTLIFPLADAHSAAIVTVVECKKFPYIPEIFLLINVIYTSELMYHLLQSFYFHK